MCPISFHPPGFLPSMHGPRGAAQPRWLRAAACGMSSGSVWWWFSRLLQTLRWKCADRHTWASRLWTLSFRQLERWPPWFLPSLSRRLHQWSAWHCGPYDVHSVPRRNVQSRKSRSLWVLSWGPAPDWHQGWMHPMRRWFLQTCRQSVWYLFILRCWACCFAATPSGYSMPCLQHWQVQIATWYGKWQIDANCASLWKCQLIHWSSLRSLYPEQRLIRYSQHITWHNNAVADVLITCFQFKAFQFESSAN